MIGDFKWLNSKFSRQSAVVVAGARQAPGRAQSDEMVQEVPMPDIYSHDDTVKQRHLKYLDEPSIDTSELAGVDPDDTNRMDVSKTRKSRSRNDAASYTCVCMTDESSEVTQPYEIVSIRRAEPPPDGKGPHWYRYVIALEGTNNIHGCRQGGLKAVTKAVEEIVAQLNERRSRHTKKQSRTRLALKKNNHKSPQSSTIPF